MYNEEKTSSETKLIFGRYKIIRKLDEGTFGKVYLGLNVKTKEVVAIKLESKSNPLYFLETEAYYLYLLKGLGIPKLLSYGQNERYNILVETLLGKSLQHLFIAKNRYLCLKDVSMIAIQIIERLKFVHSKYIIHRDIKPENFIIGYDDPFIIYLIDFGLSKKYRSSRTGKHVKFSVPKRITGTARYSSLNSLRGCQVSRRDDLEAAAYVIIYLMRGGLPWENIEVRNKYEKYRKIYRLKVLYTPEKLCENLPKEVAEFLSYCRSLDFEQEPNYDYCISLFNNILIKNGTYNDLMFSWIKNPSLIKKLKKYNDNLGYKAHLNISRLYDISKRKSSPQTRLYQRIQNSFEKKRRLNSLTNTYNSFSFEENILSTDKIFSMDINDPKIIDANDSKNTNINFKVNSVITNESTNINTTNRENIIYLNKNYKQEKKKPTLNMYTNEISNNKRNENKKASKNKSNQKPNLNKGVYQSNSEKKKYISNIIIEKIDKRKLDTKFLENNNCQINDKKMNNKMLIGNIKIKNNNDKKYSSNIKRIKLINIEKNNLQNISQNNLQNALIQNKINKNKEKNAIRITNIYKTKINDKTNYFNIIHNNTNQNIKDNIFNTDDNNKSLMNNSRNNHMKITNMISKLNKANNNIMLDNQKEFKNFEEFNLRNRLKINNNNHENSRNYISLEKSNSLGFYNIFRKKSFIKMNKSNNLDIYPLNNIHQINLDSNTYTRKNNNFYGNQIIKNFSFLHHNKSHNKFISNSSDKNYLNRINLSNEINKDYDFYNKEKDRENDYLNNNIIKKYLANDKNEGYIKKILSIHLINNKNLNNFERSQTNLLKEKKNISNYLNYSANIKSQKIKNDKINYYETFNNIQNTNNSTLKNSVLSKKYNFKYNKKPQITDVNLVSSGISNNINLSQIYNHNISNKNCIKSKISFCDLNRNDNIKINTSTSQINPKIKKNTLKKKIIQSYKNNNNKNPLQYKSKFRAILDAKEDE